MKQHSYCFDLNYVYTTTYRIGTYGCITHAGLKLITLIFMNGNTFYELNIYFITIAKKK